MEMGEIWRGNRLLLGFPLLGEVMVGTDCAAVHLRCLHQQENQVDMVEGTGKRHCPHHHELGGCHRVRLGGGVFRQQLLLSELPDSFLIAGEDTDDR